MNHEACDALGREILMTYFQYQDKRQYSLGEFSGDLRELEVLVDQWWLAYKEWEQQDTLAAAYSESRLTCKGTSTMSEPLNVRSVNLGHNETIKDLYRRDTWGNTSKYQNSLIAKTNASIVGRMKPESFLEGNKAQLGYHDLSALVLNPAVAISKQQYKTVTSEQVYGFMPIAPSIDQCVFQNINMVAKLNRESCPSLYEKVVNIRNRMTRIKLASGNDMKTVFIRVGTTKHGHDKFKYVLGMKTDVSKTDVADGLVDQSKFRTDAKTANVTTTPAIYEARRNAAINYEAMVKRMLGKYAEVSIAYRQHARNVSAGRIVFPMFAQFDSNGHRWIVGDVDNQSTWSARQPGEFFSDKPVL